MSNRILLAAVAGLGALCCLLCLVMAWRESGNAAAIAALKDELHTLRGESREEAKGIRESLKATAQSVAAAETSLAGAKGGLGQARQDIGRLRAALSTTEAQIKVYQSKPWLNQPGAAPPWGGELAALHGKLQKLEQAVGKMLAERKDKPAGGSPEE